VDSSCRRSTYGSTITTCTRPTYCATRPLGCPPSTRAPPYPLPDLAIEIRSPSTWRYDVGTKKRVYEREGLPELWLVDGESSVLLVFRRSVPTAPVFDVELELDRSATLTSPLLPGFALDVGAPFDLG